MLQQTTVAAVIPYYKKWVSLFPSLRSLARASRQRVLKAWQGLGYYQRARNLHAAAGLILKNHHGKIPDKYQDLRKLPGFGPYTTAAVLSIAFNQPYPLIDANIRRVLMRLALIKAKTCPSKDHELLAYLKPHFPARKPGLFNQALMELGSLVCRPRNPLCLQCPLQDHCLAFQAGEQEVIPASTPRDYRRIQVAVAVIQKKGKFFIQQRPSHGLFPDLWEFPGGKIETGETAPDALRREIREELGAEIGEAHLIIKVRYSYTQFRVELLAYECRLKTLPEPRNKNVRWVSLPALEKYPLPSGTVKIVKFLESRLQKSRRADS